MDSMVKLWELSTSRCLIAYTGAGSTGAMTTKTNAVFNHTEDYGNIYITLLTWLRSRVTFGLYEKFKLNPYIIIFLA